MNDISQSFCDAIALFANSSLERYKGAITIEAEIVETQDAGKRIYTIKYMNSTYTASASDSFAYFQPGNKVYVLIPDGDFSKEKIILGLVNPEKHITAATSGQVLHHIEKSNNLFIEDDYFAHLCSYKTELERNIPIVFSKAQFAKYFHKYKTYLFSFKIKTTLPKEQQVRGNYGLKLRLFFKELDTASGEVTSVPKDFIFDINNLLGNPYDFAQFTNQNFYISLGENYDLDTEPQLFAFVKDFIQDSTVTKDDIFFEDISFMAVDVLTEEQKKGYFLSIAATKGECFLSYGHTEKTLTPVLRLNGEITNTTYFPCYWFAQDDTIKEDSEFYSSRGGKGWKCLNDKIVQNSTGGDKSYQYVTNKQTLTVSKEDIITSRKYKCVLVNEAENTIFSATIEIINLDSETIIELVSATDTTSFIQGSGEVCLICRTNYEEAIEEQGTLKYVWSLFDKENNLVGANDFYTVKRYNENYVDEQGVRYKETEISFPTSLIQDLYSVNCSVYYCFTKEFEYNEYLLGTERIVLSTTIAPGYRAAISNGGLTFKYDADGDSPLLDNYDGLDIISELAPLTFTVLKSDNSELTESEYAFCKFCWKISKTSMLLPATDEYEEDDLYYYVKGQDRQPFYYTLRSKYNPSYINNTIELEIQFDDKNIIETSVFNVVKEGGNGTNGTKYIATITPIVNGVSTAETPIIICSIVSNKLADFKVYRNGQYVALDQLQFGVHVVRNGETGLIDTTSSVSVSWSMFDSSYTNPCFTVTNGNNPKEAVLKAKPDCSVLNTKVSCNILQAKIKVADAATPGQGYYIYSYYPIPITVVKQSVANWDVIPEIEGFNEVLYASDGTQPTYSSPYFFWRDKFFEQNDMPYDSENGVYDISWAVSENLVLTDETITDANNVVGAVIKPTDKYDNGNSCNYVKATATKKTYSATELQTIQTSIQQCLETIRILEADSGAIDDIFSVLQTFSSTFPTIEFLTNYITTSKDYIRGRADCLDIITLLLEDNAKLEGIITQTQQNTITAGLNTVKEKILTQWMSVNASELNLNQYKIQLTDAERQAIKDKYDNIVAADKAFAAIEKFNMDITNYYYAYQYWTKQNKNSYVTLFNTVQALTTISDDECANADIKNVLNDCVAIVKRPFNTDDCYSYNQNLEVVSLLKQRLNGYLIVDDDEYTLNDLITSYLISLQDQAEEEITTLTNTTEIFNRIVDNTAIRDTVYTIYPIVMLYNRYEMSAINEWDGNKIYTGNDDRDGEYIYAPQIGAGIKENDNSFTGMIMGNRYFDGNREVGLFGYSKGRESLFLNARDGSASFGLSGKGQIQILPTSEKALIQGGNYVLAPENKPDTGSGMQIDLTTPAIQWGNRNFSVDADGHLTAVNGKFQGTVEADNGYFHGTIEANSGKIGGWQIDETKLFSITSDQQPNKITLDPEKGIMQEGNIYNDKGEKVADGVCWSLSNSGDTSFRGNMYLANIGKLSGKLDGKVVPVVKKGKFVARGFETHRANGLLDGAHEVVIRGLDPDETNSGSIMIRKAVEGINETTYDSDNGHTYPFIVSGTGNLKIGHQKEFINDKLINRHYFSVDSSDGTLRIGYNSAGDSNFIVNGTNGNTTIGGTLNVSGSATIKGQLTIEGRTTLGKAGVETKINTAECENLTIKSGSLTLGDHFKVTNDGTITAKKGTISDWSIETPTSSNPGGISSSKTGPNGTTHIVRLNTLSSLGSSAFTISAEGGYDYKEGQVFLQLLGNGSIVMWNGSNKYTLSAYKLKMLFDNANISYN